MVLTIQKVLFLLALAVHVLKLEHYRKFSSSPLPEGKHFACLTGDKSQDSMRLKLLRAGLSIIPRAEWGYFHPSLLLFRKGSPPTQHPGKKAKTIITLP